MKQQKAFVKISPYWGQKPPGMLLKDCREWNSHITSHVFPKENSILFTYMLTSLVQQKELTSAVRNVTPLQKISVTGNFAATFPTDTLPTELFAYKQLSAQMYV